jgi:hypothetical protein
MWTHPIVYKLPDGLIYRPTEITVFEARKICSYSLKHFLAKEAYNIDISNE